MKCDQPYSVKLDAEKSAKHGVNNVPVPCGKCIQCKKRRVAQWSFRLMKELEVSTSAYFITLTYDPLHVPITKNGFMTLLKNTKQDKELKQIEITDDDEQAKKILERTDRSIQGFLKRLRYYESEFKLLYDTKTNRIKETKPLKYYAAGEYGSARKRPHAHIILFNLLDQSSIRKAWATAVMEKGVVIDYIPFGNVDIDPDVNSNNIDYTLKYICKQNHNKMHRNDDRIPEFALMSKGLGKNFITPSIETFYNRRLDINYTVHDNGYKIPMPKYYRDKMLTEETKEEAVNVIKRNVDQVREQKEKLAKVQGINLDALDQMKKIGRQAREKNYSSRNID